jgi:hypothetical protein
VFFQRDVTLMSKVFFFFFWVGGGGGAVGGGEGSKFSNSKMEPY